MPKCRSCGLLCKKIKFLCRRCNFNTKCIKNIETHMKECTGENVISTPLPERIQDEKKKLEHKLKTNDITILNLQLSLQFEQMKNKIYTNIIQTQTNINLSNIIKEHTSEVHIFNFDGGQIPIVVHDFMDEHKSDNTLKSTKKYVIKNSSKKYSDKVTKRKTTKKKIKIKDSEPDLIIEDDVVDPSVDHIVHTPATKQTESPSINSNTPKEKKTTYRRVNEFNVASEKELVHQRQDYVTKIDKKIEKIVYDNFDVSHKEIIDSLEKLFDDIVNCRKYTVPLSSVRQIRNKLLGKLTLEEYIKLLYEHITRLEGIFSERNYPKKKIQKIVASSLTPLDMRLTYYSGYTNSTIEYDEVQIFGLALEILVKHDKQFVPYDKHKFFKDIQNYSLSLLELKDCVKRCLINRYGFNNVIYIHKSKSSLSDPFSFYTLVSSSETRCWRMECRLEDFSTDLADNVLPFCIQLFRKIYNDVFDDNIYRHDYMTKAQIMEFDCEQLIQNIILLSKPMEICKLVQEIIVSKCTMTSTEYDKFDLYGDDKIQQKRFSNTKYSDKDSLQTIKSLFDGISDDDAISILNSR